MSKLIINWGKQLRGTVKPVPNKNSIIKLIPAAVLTDEPVVLHNVPKTSDVQYMLEILEKLGGTFKRTSEHDLHIDASWVDSFTIDPHLSEKMKASVMYAWPLLARFNKVSMPTPQWCKLGTRPMDAFIENMERMGCTYTYDQWSYEIETTHLQGKEIWQWFPSVTGTENLILMAVMAKGTTTIYNAACEPHTQDLCNMLVSMWARIEGIGSNKLIIEWVKKLSGTERTVISDHLDVGGLIAAAVMTDGEITIENAIIEHMHGILQVFNKLGVQVDLDKDNNTIHVPQKQELRVQKTMKGNPLRVHALQWPLLPADFVHAIVVVALKAKWQAIFDNLFYEYGFFFVQELAKMKANIILANPVTIITSGPTNFQPANLVCSDIIQASYGLLLASLAAPGTSTLNAITPLFRRFPNFIEQFNNLGADLQLTDE